MFLLIIFIYLKFAFCNSVLYFDLYDKFDNGSIYVPSSNLRQQHFLNLTLIETKLKCLRRCSRISRCFLAILEELDIQKKFKCEFFSNLTNRSAEDFYISRTNTNKTQLIYLRKGNFFFCFFKIF